MIAQPIKNENFLSWVIIRPSKIRPCNGKVIIGFLKQIGIGAIISALFAILYVYLRPIANKFENLLQTIALMAIFLNLSVGVMLKISDEDINPMSTSRRTPLGSLSYSFSSTAWSSSSSQVDRCLGKERGGGGLEDDSHTGYYEAALC